MWCYDLLTVQYFAGFVFGPADGVLSLSLHLVRLTFGFGLCVASHFTDAFLDLALMLVPALLGTTRILFSFIISGRTEWVVPRFHFKTVHGTEVHDDPNGMELHDLKAAWKEATRATGEILKEIDGSLEPEREWRMDVTNDAGQALFSLRLIPETYVEGHKLKES